MICDTENWEENNIYTYQYLKSVGWTGDMNRHQKEQRNDKKIYKGWRFYVWSHQGWLKQSVGQITSNTVLSRAQQAFFAVA